MKCLNASKANCAHQHGFTLLEVLVAITIFTIMSVTALTGMKSIMDAQQKVEQVDGVITALQRTLSYLDQDFQYLINREARDEYGNPQASIKADTGGYQLILITTMNRKNTLNQQRSSLMRVGYNLDEETLVRQAYQQVDGASEEQSNQRTLLTDIEEVQIRFMDKNNNWQLYWPTPGAVSSGSTLPKAIEFNLLHKQMGKITRLFPIPQQ